MAIYTIGTSDRSNGDFFASLAKRNVRRIVDVRSKPWSRLRQFRKSTLAEAAPLHGVTYEWFGEVLGGLNSIRTDDPAFLSALDRLLVLERDGPITIFCAEGDPTQCHRSSKVGAALLVQNGVLTTNILRDGHEELIMRTLLRTPTEMIPVCVRDAALVAARRAVMSSTPMQLLIGAE